MKPSRLHPQANSLAILAEEACIRCLPRCQCIDHVAARRCLPTLENRMLLWVLFHGFVCIVQVMRHFPRDAEGCIHVGKRNILVWAKLKDSMM